jgi:hypothetical protein
VSRAESTAGEGLAAVGAMDEFKTFTDAAEDHRECSPTSPVLRRFPYQGATEVQCGFGVVGRNLPKAKSDRARPISDAQRGLAYPRAFPRGKNTNQFEPSNYARTIYRARKAITVPKENMFNRARIESGEKCTINFAQGK